jgi:hypothetical protein
MVRTDTFATDYRNRDESLRHRVADAVESFDASLRELPPSLVDVYARRVGRIVFGALGVLAAIGMFGSVAMVAGLPGGYHKHDWLPYWLVVAWPVMLVGYLVARALAERLMAHRLRGSDILALAQKRARELERLLAAVEENDASTGVRARVEALDTSSIALPLAALSLLMPLTIHLLFAVVNWQRLDGFAQWMAYSGAIVGHAHLTLCVLSVLYAHKLCRNEHVGGGWKEYGITVAVSAVPGVVFLLLPPILTAVTGLAFAPFMYAWARSAWSREQAALAARA